MRRSNVVKSWTSKRWMMGLAISCGLLGLVLKLSYVAGSGQSTAPTAPHGPSRVGSPAGRDASNPTGPRRELAPVASDAGDRAHADGTPSGQKWLGLSDLGSEAGGDRPGHLTPRALRRLERMRGRKGPRSLRAGAGGERSVSGQGLAGGATDSTTTASAAANSDIALTSESGAQYATDSQVEIGEVTKITGSAGTMSFWLQPGWEAANQDDATLLQLGDSRLQVVKDVNYLRFEFTDDGGSASNIGVPISDWNRGEWHQITTTWNGTEYALYIDGQPITQMSHNGFVDLPSGTKLYIGSNYPEGQPVAPGKIGQVDLRNRPLTPGEVANQFLLSVGGRVK